MAPKIERIWGTISNSFKVNRQEKDSSENKSQQEKSNSGGSQSGNPGTQKESDDSAIYSKETLEKMIKEFSAPDIQVELLEIKGSFKIKMIHLPDSSVVRILSPSEFLKLKENSTADKKSRGKILDQRF